MKIIKYISIAALLALFALSACQKDIEFDQKIIAPKLVINGFITPDSVIDITVGLSKAIPGYPKDFEWVGDAKVLLFVDGVETEELKVYTIEYEEEDNDDNYYWYGYNEIKPTHGYRSGKTKIEAGKSYKLEVSHKDHGTATCQTSIPKPVQIESITNSTSIVKNQYDNYNSLQLNLKIKFADPPEEKNYYRLSIRSTIGSYQKNYYYYEEGEQEEDSTHRIIVETGTQGEFINSSDPVFSSEEDANDFLMGSPYNRYSIFTDELIEGKEYELSFVGRQKWDYDENLNVEQGFLTEQGEFHSFEIKLSSLTREAYLYMKSSVAHQWYDEDFFAEPVQVFSNIENGVGIFAGYSSSIITFSEGEFPVDGVEYEYYNNDYYW